MDNQFETLNNGATLIHRDGDVVLATLDGNYVTWSITEDGDCYWGHYFADDFKAAAHDYAVRSAK